MASLHRSLAVSPVPKPAGRVRAAFAMPAQDAGTSAPKLGNQFKFAPYSQIGRAKLYSTTEGRKHPNNVSPARRESTMSRRLIVASLFLALLAGAGAAIYKVEQGRASLRAAMASDVPPEVGQPPQPVQPSNPDPAPAHAPATPRAAAAGPKSAPPPNPGPLQPGEILDYSANVSSLNNVASLRLQIASHTDFLGKPAWHLQAFAHTQNPLRMVFELDDRFDSYSEAGALTSLQYEMHLSERGQKVDTVQRMTTTGREPASPGASQTHVLPGTRDPLGFMQFFRTVDWTKTPEVHGPVYDGHKLYEVRAKFIGTQSVKVPAGTFDTSTIDVKVLDNGAEMKDAKFTLYLGHDAAHTPVLLEAVLPFATARVELIKSR